MVNFRGRTMTLHQVWDSLVFPGGNYRSIARRVEREADARNAGDASPVDWAEESRDIARDRILVGTLKGAAGVETLPGDYAVENWSIARDRLMLAGLRLADTLNGIYDPG
jgi:hypothetical protein